MQWVLTIWLIYITLWSIFFGFISYEDEVACSEPRLLLFGLVAFWVLFIGAIFLSVYIAWVWQKDSFKQMMGGEGLTFTLIGSIFIPAVLIVFIWAIVALVQNTDVVGCGALFFGAWIFLGLTLI